MYLKKQADFNWYSCAILPTLINEDSDIKAISGEGKYGSDGFIAVLRLKTEELIWCAFFNESNPFDEIEILCTEINVRSTLGCLWKFKIRNSNIFSVECPS